MAHKVGGEVDVFCTKCKMVLAHTILALKEDNATPAKVKCNTCHTDRSYKSVSGGDDKPARRITADKKNASTRAGMAKTSDYQRYLGNRDANNAVPYSPKVTFVKDQVVFHPTFDLGVVTSVKSVDKVEILFKSGPKILVHGKGG